jgi:Trk K+ transport system NAD-binding subunit
MRVMIIGCGRVGSVLANRLGQEGHQVIVLDRDQQAFLRLSEKFSGERIVGNGLIEEFVSPTLQECPGRKGDRRSSRFDIGGYL